MRRGLLLLTVAALLVAVPATVLVWIRTKTEDRLSGLEPDPVAVILEVEHRVIEDVIAVSVAGVWGKPAVAVAPAWEGIVTRVDLDNGDSLVSGDAVARVDNLDRVAVASSSPFWRVLRRRDVGDDVVMLQSWLARAGLYEGAVDGLFGFELQAAVKAWSTEIGVSKPDGSFDPGWVVWIQEEPFSIAEVLLERGLPAPGMGTPILVGPTSLVSVALSDQDGREFEEEGEWVLLVGGVEVTIVDGSMGPDDLRALDNVLTIEKPTAGRAIRAEPVVVLPIPATAIVSNPSGELCVFVPDGDRFATARVEVSGGRIATVNVVSGLNSGDLVLSNPSDLFEAPSCP